jgi:hemerythrin-like domain-containing protein
MDTLTLCVDNRLTEVVSRCHQRLDDLFLLHQEAVLLGRFDDAIRLLNCFKELHHLHMDFEDERLIPRLDELGDRGRWPASLYTDEHAKVRDLMKKTENNLLSLSRARLSNKDLRREVIYFLDKEKTFKGLCEHHQEREEAGIFPELDRLTDTKWRTSIIEPFLTEWDSCMKRNMNIVNGIDLL